MSQALSREDTLLNLAEAAAFLRASRAKMYRLIKSGDLVAHKVGATYVFYLSDLHAYVRGERGANAAASAGRVS